MDVTQIKKVAEMIKKEGLKPSDCAYHTWRDVLNKDKKPTGKVRILVKKGETTAHVEYICPECGHYEYTTVAWKKPFDFKCSKCSFVVKVPKLKEQIKKENKAEKGSVEE